MNQSDKHNLNSVVEVVDEILEELTLEERVGTVHLNENEFRVV